MHSPLWPLREDGKQVYNGLGKSKIILLSSLWVLLQLADTAIVVCELNAELDLFVVGPPTANPGCKLVEVRDTILVDDKPAEGAHIEKTLPLSTNARIASAGIPVFLSECVRTRDKLKNHQTKFGREYMPRHDAKILFNRGGLQPVWGKEVK